jgi:glycosyltransferase involved in cell wall biosynthesis
MATFNGSRFLARQLDTIVCQLEPDDELIISDDGSSDGTPRIIDAYKGPNTRVFFNRFHNAASNFGFAMSQARKPLVFLSDQDDEWLPGKVSRLCASLVTAELVVSDCEVIDEAGRTVHASYFELARSGPGLLKNLAHNTYLGCCMAFRSELLHAALPIPPGVSHDLWLGLVAEAFGRTCFVPGPTSRFRRHGGTASFAAGSSGRSLAEKLSERLRAAVWLASRRMTRRR